MIGEVVQLFAYDVGNEILFSRVGSILGMEPRPVEIGRERARRGGVSIHQPLSIELSLPETVEKKAIRATVRIFNIGVISLSFRTSFEGKGFSELQGSRTAKVDGGRDFNSLASELCQRVVLDLRDAIVRGGPSTEPEAYTVYCLRDLEADRDVPEWFQENRSSIAGLLCESDGDKLAESQIDEVMKYRQSFEKSDLIIVDSDAALAIDLGGDFDDIVYIIELANLQLEEFRAIDNQMDRHLNRVYELIEKRPGFGIGTSSKQLQKLRSLSVDFTKLVDEVTHVTKFLGDWYLARVYLSARDRFHLDQWRESVRQRLHQSNELYSVLRSEVSERRMFWLEIIIVIFFAIDLLMIFLVKK